MDADARIPAAGRYLDWLVRQALPRWSTSGVDHQAGGFVELLDPRAQPIEAPRRTRVVARQVYVFATAAERGWLQGGEALAEHGVAFLLERMQRPDGTFATAVRPDGSVVRDDFDLYEQAFALFALAAACAQRQRLHDAAGAAALRRRAHDLLQCLRAGWGHAQGGFHEAMSAMPAQPARQPLRANPHMHLLEAALAWQDAGDAVAARPWEALAAELVELCLERFIQPDSGAVHEWFDAGWRTLGDVPGPAVEPGHQFEWAWLLLRWAQRTGDARARSAARRLLVVGEKWGVDPRRGVARNGLGADLAASDHGARLWPQTERVRAWHLAAAQAASAEQAALALRTCERALQSLLRFPMAVPAGLWHEHMNLHGSFDLLPCRASSLYHLVGAAEAVAGAAARPSALAAVARAA